MKRRRGFTLIELLVVMGILAILLSITVIAINPVEQFGKANDLAIRAAIYDIDNASGIYFATEKTYPWEKNNQCKTELEAGGEYVNMGTCIKELTNFDADDLSITEKKKYEKIHVSKCKEQAVMCYIPKSKDVIEDAIYDKWGVVDPGCPGDKVSSNENCYWCKRVKTNEVCDGNPNPTPTATPSSTTTLTFTPSPTNVPTSTPTHSPTPYSTPTPISSPSPYFYMGYCGVAYSALLLPYYDYLSAPNNGNGYSIIKIIENYPVTAYTTDALLDFLYSYEAQCTDLIMQELEDAYCSDSNNPRDFNHWFIAVKGDIGWSHGRTEWGDTGHIRKYCP